MHSGSSARVHRIAIINPLADYGISTYSHELANGLEENHVRVDLYSSDVSPLQDLNLPYRYNLIPVLGSALFKQLRVDRAVQSKRRTHGDSVAPLGCALPWHQRALRQAAKGVRPLFLPTELAFYLKSRNYDVIWTQWPQMEGYGARFWRLLRLLGTRVVHTVHNVRPHESSARDERLCRSVYGQASLLFVHSNYAADELMRAFPESRSKIVIAPHGVYTAYKRCPEARASMRQRLGIAADEPALLFCGAIKPYKNLDAVLAALADPRCSRARLIVAGGESGYPDTYPGDPLGRTRRLVQQLGITEKVRLLPGFRKNEDLSALLEASDILVLPYVQSYGSGLLLLGMTFHMHILATRAGGAEEYLARYARSTMLSGTGPEEHAVGISEALDKLRQCSEAEVAIDPALDWRNIARRCLDALNSRL